VSEDRERRGVLCHWRAIFRLAEIVLLAQAHAEQLAVDWPELAEHYLERAEESLRRIARHRRAIEALMPVRVLH